MNRRTQFHDNPPDFERIKAEIRPRLEDILPALFPNGQRSGREFAIGSTSGEKGTSLKVRLSGAKAGIWHDFATGEGGDIISLVAASRGISQSDAARLLGEIVGVI